MERVVMQFAYTNPSNEILTYGTAVTLGLDGELSISKGVDYYLTATHFCWDSSNNTNATLAAASASDAPIRAHTSTGKLRTDASNLVTSPTMRNTPVAGDTLPRAKINGLVAGGSGAIGWANRFHMNLNPNVLSG